MENLNKFITIMDNKLIDAQYVTNNIESVRSRLAGIAAAPGLIVFEERHTGECSICGKDDSVVLWVSDRCAHVYDDDESFDSESFGEDQFTGYTVTAIT